MSRTLGILGGGQLATMLCEAAARIEGVKTWVLSPDDAAPAQRAADHFLCAAYEDAQALDQLREHCDVVTVDNEHIPVAALERLDGAVRVRPSAATLATIQDRLVQRGMLADIGAPQPRYWSVADDATLATAEREASFPAVLKSRRGGYDGYGQVVVHDAAELDRAWIEIGRRPGVLETFIDFRGEVSLLGARGADGEIRYYPLAENEHRDGQLWRSELPSANVQALEGPAREIWQRIAQHLDYVGLMAVEFFVERSGGLLVNEIAPRVHNSGHATQRACTHSQFDLHVHAALDLPLPEIGHCRPTVMLNLFAEHQIENAAAARELEQACGGRIVLYGKAARPRRKTGHWLLAPSEVAAAAAALSERRAPLQEA